MANASQSSFTSWLVARYPEEEVEKFVIDLARTKPRRAETVLQISTAHRDQITARANAMQSKVNTIHR